MGRPHTDCFDCSSSECNLGALVSAPPGGVKQPPSCASHGVELRLLVAAAASGGKTTPLSRRLVGGGQTVICGYVCAQRVGKAVRCATVRRWPGAPRCPHCEQSVRCQVVCKMPPWDLCAPGVEI